MNAPSTNSAGQNDWVLVLRAAVVVGEREALVLDRKGDGIPERGDSVGQLGGALVELETVVSDIADAFDADESLGLLAGSAADACDEQVAGGQACQLELRLGRDEGKLRPCGDRGERAVDVEEERSGSGSLAQRGQQIHRTRIRA